MPVPTAANLETSILWLAHCSNAERSAADCADYTRTMLAACESEQRPALEELIGGKIVTACINRGERADFAEALEALTSRSIGMGCLHALVELRLRSVHDAPDPSPHLDAFAAKYGEDREFRLEKLRWLTLFGNYGEQQVEVERLLGLLTGETA